MNKDIAYIQALIENKDYLLDDDIKDILTLISLDRWKCAKRYLQDTYEYTPNKNYTYRTRNVMKEELKAMRKYIKGIENDE